MSRKIIIVILLCTVLAGLGLWLYLFSSTTVEEGEEDKNYVSEEVANINMVGDKPTQDYKLPSGHYTKVMAGELVLKITNPDTVKLFGSDLKPVPGLPQIYVLTVPFGSDLNKAAAEAIKKPGVKSAEPNYVTTGSAVPRTVPNDPHVLDNQQQQLLDVSAPEGWSVNTNGVIIAVLDTGVQTSHPDLVGKVVDAGMDFVNTSNDTNGAEDDHGHGTHVAGIAAAKTNNAAGTAGISWTSGIIPVKILDRNMAGNTTVMAQGIRYAVERGVRVINMSVNTACSDNTDCTTQEVKDAIDFATANNVVVVVSSGNASGGGPISAVAAPASYAPVIAVGGTVTGKTPPTRDTNAKYGASGPQVDLSAPYGRIYSLAIGSAYQSRSGTSGSAPQVAGAAAMMLAIKPELTAARVEAILRATADGPANNGIGAGRLNLYKALQYTRDCP